MNGGALAPGVLLFCSTIKNKFPESGIFLVPEKHQSTHHDLPATHHKITTKKPRSAHHFSQNPL
jgi:hypothetical protein